MLRIRRHVHGGKSIFNRTRTNENWKAYKRQRNLCIKSLRQNTKIYYVELDPKVVNDNKKFWKTVKPLFSNRVQSSSSIILLKNSKVESTESKVAEVFNKYFVNIVESLDTTNIHEQEPLNGHMGDTSFAIVERYGTYPSIIKIKSSVNNTIKFSFRKLSIEEMLLQLQNVDPKKGSPQEAIPPKILKSNSDMFCFHLTDLFNGFIEASSSPDSTKNAEVTSIFKKDDNMNKVNYRPISLLPTIAKIFEHLIHQQLSEYI